MISLSPRGAIPEARLERHLKRMNADDYVLNGEKTEKVLKRMEREGYIVKVRERDGGGEESVDYIIGPRGKAEVGERGVADMVRKVYGKKDVEADELEKKLVRSLGDVVIVQKNRRVAVEEDETGNGGFEENKNGDANEHSAMSRARPIPGRRKKRSRDEEEAEEDDAEDENGEEQENSDDDDDGDDDDGDE